MVATLRPVWQRDVETVLDLLGQAGLETTETEYFDLLSHPSSRCMVLVSEGKIVGVLTYLERQEEIALDTLYVAEEYQDQGIEIMALQHILNIATVSRLPILIPEDQAEGLQFFHEAGLTAQLEKNAFPERGRDGIRFAWRLA